MADGLHAVVFVDNHDNQRGHGGAGGVLTASGPGHNDWQYKVASAFMLAHDYGFKRVMSSYYFDNSDQGPPGAQPGPPGQACGNGWPCEHRLLQFNFFIITSLLLRTLSCIIFLLFFRWSSIMNMVKFANAVVGTGVENWQEAGSSLGFSRYCIEPNFLL